MHFSMDIVLYPWGDGWPSLIVGAGWTAQRGPTRGFLRYQGFDPVWDGLIKLCVQWWSPCLLLDIMSYYRRSCIRPCQRRPNGLYCEVSARASLDLVIHRRRVVVLADASLPWILGWVLGIPVPAYCCTDTLQHWLYSTVEAFYKRTKLVVYNLW